MVAETFRQQVLSFNDRILKHLMHTADFEEIERRPRRSRVRPTVKRTEELEQLDTFLEVEVERYSASACKRACTDSDVEYGSYFVSDPITRRKRNVSQDGVRSRRSQSASRCPTIADDAEYEGTSQADAMSFVSTQADLDFMPQSELEDINTFIASAEPYAGATMGYPGGVYSQVDAPVQVGGLPALFFVAVPWCTGPVVSALQPLSQEATAGDLKETGRHVAEETTAADSVKKGSTGRAATQTVSSEKAPVAPGRVLKSATGTSDAVSVTESAPAEHKPKTTIMLRNLPNDYTRAMVLELFDSAGFNGAYDFVYVPVDFRTWAGLGYCFVNLSVEAVERFWKHFDGFCSWTIPSQKVCRAAWGEPLQGLEEHIERYRNSSVMHEDVPDELKPVLFENGERVNFPPPTKRIRPMRIKQRC